MDSDNSDAESVCSVKSYPSIAESQASNEEEAHHSDGERQPEYSLPGNSRIVGVDHNKGKRPGFCVLSISWKLDVNGSAKIR